VHAAEVVKSKPACDCRPVVFPLLAEGIREARKAACRHSRAEVATLNNRGTDSFGVGLTHDWDYLHAGYFSGRIPCFAFAGSSVDFDELREIAAVVKRRGDRGTVCCKAVRRDLKISRCCSVPQAFNENVREGTQI